MKKGELLEFLHDAKDLFRLRRSMWYDSQEERAYKEIVALIKKEVTEEWIEEKAKELHDKLWPGEKCGGHCNRQKEIKDFIRKIVKEAK